MIRIKLDLIVASSLLVHYIEQQFITSFIISQKQFLQQLFSATLYRFKCEKYISVYFDTCELWSQIGDFVLFEVLSETIFFVLSVYFNLLERWCQLQLVCISQPLICLHAVHEGLEKEKKEGRISIKLLGTDQELIRNYFS